jgi:hypothetical protein
MIKLTRRDAYLRKKYKITEAIYKKMLAVNGGKCWICIRLPKKSVLNVDHDHKTGQVRGLLCFFCNKYMIGRRRREHAHLFERAAQYLNSKVDWREST